MFKMIKEIVIYRDLLWMLTLRDIRIRYKQAAMGFLWAIFMPTVAVMAGILIKKAMSVVSGQPMDIKGIVSISVKVLPWAFFISSIRFAVQALVGNASLVTKIYFPRAVLPLAAMLACLFDFGISIVVLIILLTIIQIGVGSSFLFVPFILLLIILFTVGLGLMLSAANLFFRDVKYVVEIILMFGIFFVPVFFDASMFGKWEPIVLMNPIGSLLEALNSCIVLHKIPESGWLIYSGIASVAMFLIGITVFGKNEPMFAENI